MGPCGRKDAGRTPMGERRPAEDRAGGASDSEKEEKRGPSGSEDAAYVKIPAIAKLVKKRTTTEIVGEVGGTVQTMLEKFGAEINNTILTKKKRLSMYAEASLKSSNKKIEHIFKTQQEQRQKLIQEFSQQFLTLFQQWEIDMQNTKKQEEKLANFFQQQRKFFQQSRIVHSQRLKTIKQLYEQFVKCMEDLEKNNDTLIDGAQNELKKEMAMLQKQIMMDTQQQEKASVRKSLQSMLFW